MSLKITYFNSEVIMGNPALQLTYNSGTNAENTYLSPLFGTEVLPNYTGLPLFSPTGFDSPPPSSAGIFPFTGWGTSLDTVAPYAVNALVYNNGVPGTILDSTAMGAIYMALGGTGANNVTLTLYPYYSAPIPICFKEDSEILTYDESADKESYVKVQDLRKGMLVKTLRSGYVPVKIATTSKIYNPGNSHRSESRLYRCPKSAFPELKEDLIITGHHSILVDNLTEEQINEIQETYGRIYITEKKYRLPAFVDERTVPYEEEGTFNIYHFALENSNVKANYGVYANGGSGLESPNAFSGLLVESANEWRLREKSGHKIISE